MCGGLGHARAIANGVPVELYTIGVAIYQAIKRLRKSTNTSTWLTKGTSTFARVESETFA